MHMAARRQRTGAGRKVVHLWAGIAVVAALMIGSAGVPSAAPAQAGPATVTISGTSPAGSFSPNGDGYDDTLSVSFCLDAGANVTATARDDAGERVRTLAQAVSYPATCGNSVSWDGRDDAGAPVPDGTYTLELEAVNASGSHTRDSLEVVVDRRVPGVVVAPEPGATLSGTANFEFDPTDGFEIAYVDFVLSGSGGVSCQVPRVSAADADGVFRASLDTAVSCGDGPRTVTAQVQFTDALGGPHWWVSPGVPVTLSNPAPPAVAVMESGPRVFSPNGDGHDDALSFFYCTADAVEGGELAVTVRVLDAAGGVVRSLVDEPRSPAPNCEAWWLGYFTFGQWDGLDDNAVAAPDGDYTIEVRATDPTGAVGVKTLEVVVDRRVPGVVVAPEPGATLSGTANFEFDPTDGFEIHQVDYFVSSAHVGVYNASPDGVWRSTYPVGQLPVGPASLTWSVQWADEFGATHYYGGQHEVAIDPTSIPLLVEADPDSGQAPLDVELTVTASDPNSEPLQLSIDFGDSSADHTSTITAPYEPLVVTHTYDEPGTYLALVSVSNGRGGYSSQAVPIAVAGQPNSPPVADVGTAPTSGTAPLDVATTINATDPDADALTYIVDHGDGTSPVTGPLPAAEPVAHRYTAAGTYIVRTQVTDGQLTVSRTSRIIVAPGEPLIASAGDDRSAVEGDTLQFDASGSRPAAAITSYQWDFGDGSSSTEPAPEHTYDEAGTYEVSLTVGSGNATAQDTATVVIQPPPPTPGLGVTVAASGMPVPGADVVVIQPDGTRISAVTDDEGNAHLDGLPDGELSVYAYAPGFQPAVATATITDGSGSIEIGLITGEVGAAQVDSRRLTYNEILDLGIDPEAPENQNIYEFEINLYFIPATQDPEAPAPEITVPVIVGERGLLLIGDLNGGYQTCDGGCTLNWEGNTVVPTVHHVDQQPIIQWLIIPGRASFLKEFFDVSLIVQNLAPEEFTFEHGSVTLDLPTGLSLAPSETPQSLTLDVPDIPGMSNHTTTWTVRGDIEGEYEVRAEYTGVLEPVGKPVRLEAQAQDALKIWGGSALEMIVTVDKCAVRLGPYHIDVELRNVTADVPIYNAEVELLDRPRDAPSWQAMYTLAPPKRQMTPAIGPGASKVFEFVVYPALGRDDVRELELVEESSFIQRTGGSVGIPTELRVRDEGTDCTEAEENVGWVDIEVRKETSPDTAIVTWQQDVTSPSGVPVKEWEVLGTSVLDRPLEVTRFARRPASETSVTLQADSDRDLRYVTVAAVLANGDVEHLHMLGEGPPRYVALGDSFSAGEGLPAFEPATDTADNNCHRSYGSYSRQLAQDASQLETMHPATFQACSGAIVNDYRVSNPGNAGEPPQGDHVSEFTDRVTLTMGGNDVGFAALAKWCIASYGCGENVTELIANYSVQSVISGIDILLEANECMSSAIDPAVEFQCDLIESIWNHIDTIPGERSQSTGHVGDGVLSARLRGLYNSLLDDAPNAQILVGNYPQVVDTSDVRCALRPDIINTPGAVDLSADEKSIVLDFTNKLNGAVATAVTEVAAERGEGARLNLVNVNNEFKGHELCSAQGLNPNSGLNSLVIPGEICGDGVLGAVSCSLHPNSIGQAAYYRAFDDAPAARTSSTVHQGEVAPAGSVNVRLGEALYVELSSPGAGVGLRLTAPDGAIYGRDSHPSEAAWTVTETSETVVIPDAVAGEWTMSAEGLDVSDTGETATVFVSATAPPPSPPSATATVEIIDPASRTVRLDSSNSTSPNGEIASHRWLFDDGTTATGDIIEHAYSTPGTYAVGLIITDKAGLTATTVLDPFEFVDHSPLVVNDQYTGEEDTPLVVPAPGVLENDSDADGDDLAVVIEIEPKHGTVEQAADGSFTYTPERDFAGDDSFTYRANDGTATSDPATVSVTVTPANDAPVATNDGFEMGEDEELVVEAPGVLDNDTDVDGDDLVAVLASPPANGALELSAEGRFTYTPEPGYSGAESFTYQANDGAVSSEPATVNITVEARNDGPIASPDAYGGPQDQSIVVEVPGVLGNDSDPDGDALTAVVIGAPSNGQLDLVADGSFTYMPDAGFVGTDSFTYAADDGSGRSDEVTVTLELTERPNTGPTATADTADVSTGEELVVEAPGVLGNDTEPDGDDMSAVLVTGPTHGTLVLASDGGYTYTPEVGFDGTDTFTYVAHDGTAASEPAAVIITVTPLNRPPIASGDIYTATEDEPLAIATPGVLSNDTDADGDPLSAKLVTGAAHGQIELRSDGSFAYVPQAGFHGTSSFTYTASDGSADSEPATVTIEVVAVNHPPVAGSEAYATAAGEPLIVAAPGVLSNDSDPDSDELTAVLVSDVERGALELAGDGSFIYTPDDGFTGVDTFTYRANDGSTDSQVVTVSVQVAAPTGRTLSVADAAPVAEPGLRESAYSEFVVSLSSPASSPVTVHAATADGTATVDGGDYRSTGVDLRFPRGTTSKIVKVRVLADTATEAEEHFALVLSQASGASIRDGSATGTIRADAAPPALSVADAPPVAEPGRRQSAYAEFVVSLSSPASSPVTVHAATVDGTATVDGGDYRSTGIDLRFPRGTTSTVVRVKVLADRDQEPEEYFNLVLSASNGAAIDDGSGVATILNTS
jgi:PKD repeat protein/flagellar hook assembly protein FlgD